METCEKPISVLEPVGEAIEKTKILLFKPFNMEKWFLIGFCAWLANLLAGGFSIPAHFGGGGSDGQQAGQEWGKVTEAIKENIFLFGIIGSIIALFVITILIVLLWVSCRGHFMFVDCLAKNKAEVANPWRNFKRQANSLFLFRLFLSITGTFLVAAFCVPIIFIALAFSAKHITLAALIASATVLGLFMLLSGIFFTVIRLLTMDFVTPIMYLNKIGIIEAWKKYLPILGRYFGTTLLYVLFKIVVFIAVGAIEFMVFLIGCLMCCASFLLFIPYIGTVVYLPFFSFLRLYPLCFLKQFGSEYDVFV